MSQDYPHVVVRINPKPGGAFIHAYRITPQGGCNDLTDGNVDDPAFWDRLVSDIKSVALGYRNAFDQETEFPGGGS